MTKRGKEEMAGFSIFFVPRGFGNFAENMSDIYLLKVSLYHEFFGHVIASETEWSEAISCLTGSYEIASSFVPHSSQ